MYTLNKANEVCNKFQYLVGKEFDIHLEGSPKIHYVLVAPHDLVAQNIFLAEFRQSHNQEEAMAGINYKGHYFDVLLVNLFDIDSLHRNINNYAIDANLIEELTTLSI
jgi:hypothetical protein